MSLLDMAIAAARSGNRAEARMLLEAVTLEEPDNERAFLWLSSVLDNPALAVRCLERVLEINPHNEQARRGLAWFQAQRAGQGEAVPQRLPDAELAALLQSLHSPDERAAAAAIRRLGEAGDSRAVAPLVEFLTSSTAGGLQTQARGALIAIGTPAVEAVLRRLMGEQNLAVAAQLALVLARIRSIAALEACREVVSKGSPAARFAMARSLSASVHGEAALRIVGDYLADERQDERARAAAATALGQAIKARALDAAQGVRFLMEVRADPSLPLSVRQAALVALGLSGQSSVMRYLFEASGDRDERMRIAAVDALAAFTPPPVALLDRLARSTDPAVRTRANQHLNRLHAARPTSP